MLKSVPREFSEDAEQADADLEELREPALGGRLAAAPAVATGIHRRGEPDGSSTAILDLRLQKLTGLERDKVKEEHSGLLARIKDLRALLGDENAVLGVIKTELAEEIATDHLDGLLTRREAMAW